MFVKSMGAGLPLMCSQETWMYSSLVRMQRKVEKVEKVEINKQMTSEPGSNNMELMVELVEHIVQISGSLE